MIKMATKNNKKVLLPFILLALICLCYVYPVSFFTSMLENPTDRFGNGTEGRFGGDTYRIDSKTILTAIKNGDANIFTLQNDLPQGEEAKAAVPVEWSQADFIKVFTTFQHGFLSATAADQKIKGMHFRVDDCKDVNLGPQSVNISTEILKSGIFVWPPFQVVSYDYWIDPPNNEVFWKGDWFDRYAIDELKRHSFLDLANIKISAEEALRIAELNGGESARLSMENRCSINVDIYANFDNGNWVVTYGSGFRIEIDKTDGSYIISANGGAGRYGFDSQTILDSLKSGNKDAFRHLSFSDVNKTISKPVHWTQDDYYRVADAFIEVVWKERLSEWKLKNISFETECDDASFGPQSITLSIFQQGFLGRYYYDGRIAINAGQNILTWSRKEDYKPRYDLFLEREQTYLSWSQIKIPANQALQIIEEQGGKNLRVKLKQNSPGQNCEINGLLNRYFSRERPQWEIRYEWIPSKSSGLISSFVDIDTGAFKIFNYYETVP